MEPEESAGGEARLGSPITGDPRRGSPITGLDSPLLSGRGGVCGRAVEMVVPSHGPNGYGSRGGGGGVQAGRGLGGSAGAVRREGTLLGEEAN